VRLRGHDQSAFLARGNTKRSAQKCLSEGTISCRTGEVRCRGAKKQRHLPGGRVVNRADEVGGARKLLRALEKFAQEILRFRQRSPRRAHRKEFGRQLFAARRVRRLRKREHEARQTLKPAHEGRLHGLAENGIRDETRRALP